MTKTSNIKLCVFLFFCSCSVLAGIPCPLCNEDTENQGDKIVCPACGYTAEILRIPSSISPYRKQPETSSSDEGSLSSDDMEDGACGTGVSIESENAQMFQQYEAFLNEEQQIELAILMSRNLTIRPKIEQWFCSNVDFSWQDPAVCFIAPEQMSEACGEASVQPSTATLLIEKGGTVIAVKDMKDHEIDFFETLSNLPSAMMGRQLEDEEFHKDIGGLLQEYSFCPFTLPLGACFASDREMAHFIFAFIQSDAVFFHGMIVEGRTFKYLIPGFQSGVILVKADMVEMLVSFQAAYGFKLYIYEDKPQKRKNKANKKLAAELLP